MCEPDVCVCVCVCGACARTRAYAAIMGIGACSRAALCCARTGLVHAVHVAKSGGDGEHRRDRVELLVDHPRVGRGGVELGGVDALVVHAVLHAAGDADLHLEDQLHRGHLLEVLGADVDVLLVVLLREVKHVRGEERLAELGKVLLVGLEHAARPRGRARERERSGRRSEEQGRRRSSEQGTPSLDEVRFGLHAPRAAQRGGAAGPRRKQAGVPSLSPQTRFFDCSRARVAHPSNQGSSFFAQ